MGKLVMDMSMSLDGFIAGPNDDVERLHHWIFEGQTAHGTNIRDEVLQNTGAFVMGRRTFELHPSGLTDYQLSYLPMTRIGWKD